jgi:hypothetical protein
MLVPKPFYRTNKFWQILIPALLFLAWILFFSHEIGLFFDFFLNGGVFPATGPSAAEYRYAILVVVISGLAFLAYFIASMFFVSQFVLPVRTANERRKVFERLMDYLFGSHGPVVFIREGVEVANPSELQSSLPGVAFVDVNSAIVLEKQPLATRSDEPTNVSQGEETIQQTKTIFYKIVGDRKPGRPRSRATARAVGPGIVFTRRGERIRGVVNLRNHFKIAINVPATTRDGFQVQGHVITIFSLGLPPEVVRIGFCACPDDPDPFRPANLLGIQVSKGKIKAFEPELDESDQQEAYVYAMRTRPGSGPILPTRQARSRVVNPLYTFDPDRIFRAVYADARRVDNDQKESWQDLPSRVASEIFKTMLAANRYTDLYLPANPTSFPLWDTFRPEFTRNVRNQGVLSFQLYRRKDGKPFEIDQAWNENDLEIFPPQALRGTKVLRDRGIRMIAASFPEIRPINETVREKLLDFWRAKQQHSADLTRAPYDYQKIRIVTLARQEAQHQIVESLKRILEDTSIPREAVALRFLQAIQTLAKDPESGRIMPQETIQLIDKFQNWFWNQSHQNPIT